MFPSKTDRILSRYRPIAPKPSPFPPPSPFPSSTNDPSSTCASLDSLASSGKCSRRSRKRRAPTAAVPPSKVSRPSFLVVPAASGSSFSAAAGRPASCLQQATSDGAVPSQSLASSGDVCPDLRGPPFDRSFVADPGRHDAVRVRDLKWGIYPFSPQNIAHHGGIVHSTVARDCQNGLIPAFLDTADEDTGFMERAAASKVLPEKVVSPGCGSSSKACGVAAPAGFTEMIRGITRLPTAADVQSLMQGRVTAMSGSATLRTNLTDFPAKGIQRNQSVSPQHVASAPADMAAPSWVARNPSSVSGCEASLFKPGNAQYCKSSWSSHSLNTDANHDRNETGVVTLSLLPAEPSRPVSTTTETSLTSCASAVMSRLGQQPMVADEGFSGCTSCAKQPMMMDGSSINQAYLEQVYGASADSVLLLDENNYVLWSNRAYARASKSSSERTSHNDSVSGPYIDPLGHPTPLGSFNLNWNASSRISKVTLWGFLKKLVVYEPELSAGCRGTSSCTRARVLEAMDNSNELSLRLGENNEALTSQSSINAHMQTTLPRPRVSTITLESITDLHPQFSPMIESLEAVEGRLASGNPAFITDSMCDVKWTNLALMRMLGHTENMLAGSTSPSDVLEVYSAEKPPHAVSAFSGRVNVEWVKAGRRRSVTMPCDVCLLASSSPGMWVWKLDVSASLGLSCASH